MAAHAAALFEGLRDPALYTWMDEEPPESLGWLEARFGRLESRRSPDGRERWLNWAVWSRADARHVGSVQATVRADDTAAVAWVLFSSAQGRGYATEAVEAMLEALRVAYGVAAFTARVDPRNVRSLALARRLGFVVEGEAPAGGGADGDDRSDLLLRRPAVAAP